MGLYSQDKLSPQFQLEYEVGEDSQGNKTTQEISFGVYESLE